MQHKVEFQNSKKMRISGVFHYDKKRRPGVIVSHGFLATRRHGFIKKLSNDLYRNGFAVLRFDYTGGIGDSDGSLSTVTVAQQLDDLKSAIDFMERSPHVKKGMIGLAGHSMGGALSMHVTSTDDRVKALAMVSSPANFHYQHFLSEGIHEMLSQTLPEEIQRRRPRVGDIMHFYGDTRRYDCLTAAEKVTIPTILIHGDKDSIVPMESSKAMFDKMGCEKDMKIIKRATHGLLLKSTSDHASKYVVDWMKKYLAERHNSA